MQYSFNKHPRNSPTGKEDYLEFQKRSLQHSILTSTAEAVRILGRAEAASWVDLDILPLVETTRKLLSDESLSSTDCREQLDALIPLLGLEEFDERFY